MSKKNSDSTVATGGIRLAVNRTAGAIYSGCTIGVAATSAALLTLAVAEAAGATVVAALSTIVVAATTARTRQRGPCKRANDKGQHQ